MNSINSSFINSDDILNPISAEWAHLMSCLLLELDAASMAEALVATRIKDTILWRRKTDHALISIELLWLHVQNLNDQLLILQRRINTDAALIIG
jgi:hypothetical protein